eukprot:6209267-Pleurochrysis_carterae.AAC.3
MKSLKRMLKLLERESTKQQKALEEERSRSQAFHKQLSGIQAEASRLKVELEEACVSSEQESEESDTPRNGRLAEGLTRHDGRSAIKKRWESLSRRARY